MGPVSETNLYVFEISNLYRSQFSGNQYAGCGQGVKKCFNSAARGNGFTTFTGLQVGSITTTAGAVTPDKPAKVRDEFGYHMNTCRTSGDDTMGLVNIVRFVYKTLFGHVLKNLPQVSMSINLRKHGLLKLEDWRKYNALWQKMKTVQW